MALCGGVQFNEPAVYCSTNKQQHAGGGQKEERERQCEERRPASIHCSHPAIRAGWAFISHHFPLSFYCSDAAAPAASSLGLLGSSGFMAGKSSTSCCTRCVRYQQRAPCFELFISNNKTHLDIVRVGEEHGHTIDAHSPATRWRKAVFQGRAKRLINHLSFVISSFFILLVKIKT